jgi:predicted metal-dependent enzyme (double-stranded beta helix superfamily)
LPNPADLAVAAFMDQAVDLLTTRGAGEETFASIAEMLRALCEEPRILSDDRLAGLHGSTASASILAERADGPVLMLARFPEEASTPVHNHNSWGIICVIQGRDRHIRWERRDDGTDPTRAELQVAETRELDVGDVLTFGEPPGDIHSQQGLGGPAWELVFFGRDPDARPRAYFEPDTGVVTYRSARR